MTLPSAPDRGSIRTSAILLIVLGFLCGGWIPTIFGIIALVQMESDPRSARTMNKVGWIVFCVIVGLVILGILAYFVFGIAILGIFGIAASTA